MFAPRSIGMYVSRTWRWVRTTRQTRSGAVVSQRARTSSIRYAASASCVVKTRTAGGGQGTQQLIQKDKQDVVAVFILPPSIDELRRRLETRAQDSAAVIDARMDRARAEISHWDAYDYVVINDDVNACFAKVREILDAERRKRRRQTGLIDFVRAMMG